MELKLEEITAALVRTSNQLFRNEQLFNLELGKFQAKLQEQIDLLASKDEKISELTKELLKYKETSATVITKREEND